MGSGEGRRVGPGGGSGGVGRRGLSIELWTPGLDAGVGRRGWAPGFGPGAGERVGRPKRRPGQLGGRTVGWAAGRPNGRVKEWKGWQGRTEKDGNGKGPGPSGSRSVKGSFGQPLRSAKGPVKGPVRPSLGPPEFLPERVAPRQGPARPSLGSPEFLPGRVAPPLHVRVPTAPFPLSSPFMSSSSPLPLRRLLPLRRPAPPSCVPVRLSRRGRDSTAGGGIARAKMWNGISGAERRAAAASGAPLPRPPGSRPEPTPGRQTSRERGGRGIPEKEKTKSRKGFSSRRGRNRRSGETAEPRREDRWSNAAVQR